MMPTCMAMIPTITGAVRLRLKTTSTAPPMSVSGESLRAAKDTTHSTAATEKADADSVTTN